MTSSGITRINRKINCAGHRTDLKSDRSARVTVRFCSLPPNNRDVVKLVITQDFDSWILGSNPNIPANLRTGSISGICGELLTQR